MEWGNEGADLRLTLWPGGEERLIAVSSPHGANAAGWSTTAGRAPAAGDAPAWP